MTRSRQQDRAELKQLFDRFDIDKNGYIDKAEFRQVLRVLGENPSDEMLSLEFTAIDTNDDGAVTFDEFVAWWSDV